MPIDDRRYVPTGWHAAHLNVADVIGVEVPVATPTHLPLERDFFAQSDPSTGMSWETNAKSGAVRWEGGGWPGWDFWASWYDGDLGHLAEA